MIQLYMELAADQVLLNPRLRPNYRSVEWYDRLIRIRKGMGCQALKSRLSPKNAFVGLRLAELANEGSSSIQTFV